MAKVKKPLQAHQIARHQVTFAVLRAISKIPNSKVAEKAGVCAATVRQLRRPVSEGGTMYPRLNTVASIGQAFGYQLKLVERSEAAVAKVRAEYAEYLERPRNGAPAPTSATLQ